LKIGAKGAEAATDLAADGAKAGKAGITGAEAVEAERAASKADKAASKADSVKQKPSESAPDGIVYLRTDKNTGKLYVGQTKSKERFAARQNEHARAKPDADYKYNILDKEEPGDNLDRLEEYYIRKYGGLTNTTHPDGGLENWRHQMSDNRYNAAGGDPR
jgi:hypothetical protein